MSRLSTVFSAMAKHEGRRKETKPSLVNNVRNGHEDAAAKIGLANVTVPLRGDPGLTELLCESY